MPKAPQHLFLLTAPGAQRGEYHQMLVRAESLKHARELASGEAVASQPHVWTDAKQTQTKRIAVDVSGRPEVVIAAVR